MKERADPERKRSLQQNLVDEGVELGDVLLEAALALRVGTLLHELDRHPDARERRAQLVRRRGEQELVRAHQPLDALGCLVEALGEARDLVAALDLHPGREIAFPKRGDAALQALEA